MRAMIGIGLVLPKQSFVTLMKTFTINSRKEKYSKVYRMVVEGNDQNKRASLSCISVLHASDDKNVTDDDKNVTDAHSPTSASETTDGVDGNQVSTLIQFVIIHRHLERK
jgi:hypothetical protein